MSKESSPSPLPAESRRSFLAKLGLGAAAMALVSSPIFHWGQSKTDRSQPGSQDLPGGDSIFRPRSR